MDNIHNQVGAFGGMMAGLPLGVGSIEDAHKFMEVISKYGVDGILGLVEENKALKEALDKAHQPTVLYPQYPSDFTKYDGFAASDIEIQGMVNDTYDALAEGKVEYRSMGDTSVVTFNDKDEVVTIVARNTQEHVRPRLYPEIEVDEEGQATWNPEELAEVLGCEVEEAPKHILEGRLYNNHQYSIEREKVLSPEQRLEAEIKGLLSRGHLNL